MFSFVSRAMTLTQKLSNTHDFCKAALHIFALLPGQRWRIWITGHGISSEAHQRLQIPVAISLPSCLTMKFSQWRRQVFQLHWVRPSGFHLHAHPAKYMHTPTAISTHSCPQWSTVPKPRSALYIQWRMGEINHSCHSILHWKQLNWSKGWPCFTRANHSPPSLQGSLIAIELIIRHCLPKFVRWGDGTYENSTQTIQTWKFLMSCDNACLMLHTCKLQVFDNVLEFIYVLVESWELGIDLPPQSNCTRLLLQFHLGHSFGEAWHANRMLLTGSRSLDTSYDLSWVTQSNPSLQPNLCQCSTFVTFVGVHLKIWNRNPEAQAICSSLRPHTWTVEGIAWLLSKPCKAH